MLLAKNGIIPSKEWEHKSELRNKKYDTVAILLAYNKIVPPK